MMVFWIELPIKIVIFYSYVSVYRRVTHRYLYISGWWCNNHLEKYDFVNGNNYPIYEMEKMVETTNQMSVLKSNLKTGGWHHLVYNDNCKHVYY
jgi:hypothetical protein